jgi:hypothetical protein
MAENVTRDQSVPKAVNIPAGRLSSCPSLILSGTSEVSITDLLHIFLDLTTVVTKSSRCARRIVRAEAATANGLETVRFYAAAVVAASAAGVETRSVNLLAMA